ncbi:MAG: PhnD/SsuA/transferrin family substrate-binding protein [Campylobacter sp.]|nr:PhnD/SsuA/transferrin family substrate-binding protein [Campylobacter sp.]
MKLAAVIYDPKVTIIWEIIRDFFKENNFDLKPVFYKDYKMQVDGLINGEVDVTWNSPLAWLNTFLKTAGKSQNGLMRDTDRDRQSFLVVKNSDKFTKIADLKSKIIGFGAEDSPQASLILILNLHQNGLEFNKDYTEKRFDIGLGLNGDHIGGKLDSLKAFLDGKLDASWMLDLNYTS